MQGTMQGARRRGRPCTAWMDNIKTWTWLPVEESIRITEDRDKWRKYVHGVGTRTAKEQNRTDSLKLIWSAEQTFAADTSVLCYSDWLFHGESCPRFDVVHLGHAWSSSPGWTWHCSLHYYIDSIRTTFASNRRTEFVATFTPLFLYYFSGFVVHYFVTDSDNDWSWMNEWMNE